MFLLKKQGVQEGTPTLRANIRKSYRTKPLRSIDSPLTTLLTGLLNLFISYEPL